MEHLYVMGFVKGAIVGAAGDIAAFRTWKSFDDAVAYDWKRAVWRALQGGIVGLLATAGLG